MAFQYTVSVVNQAQAALSSTIDAIRAIASAALDTWGHYLTGRGTVDVEIDITTPDTPGALAVGGFNEVVAAGSNGAHAVYLPGTLSEMRTGIDANGSA